MIKLINIITQIIIVLGCCAILIFTLSIANETQSYNIYGNNINAT